MKFASDGPQRKDAELILFALYRLLRSSSG